MGYVFLSLMAEEFKPVSVTLPNIGTTTTTPIAAQVSNNPSIFGGFIERVKPLLIPIAIIAVIIILIVIVVVLFRNNSKFFKKNYYKENYKNKVKSLSYFGVRAPYFGLFFISLVTIIITIASLGILLGLGFLDIIDVTNFNAVINTFIITLIGSIFITLIFPTKFSSYPLIKNRKGDIIGFLLSQPITSTDGWLECIYFARNKWLIMKEIMVFMIPKKEKYEMKSFAKDEDGKRKIIKYKLSLKNRFWIDASGNLIVNCDDITIRDNFVYPNFSGIDDFDELVFAREQKEADIYNIYDLANTGRENAISLVGGNPYAVIPQQQKDSDKRPDEHS